MGAKDRRSCRELHFQFSCCVYWHNLLSSFLTVKARLFSIWIYDKCFQKCRKKLKKMILSRASATLPVTMMKMLVKRSRSWSIPCQACFFVSGLLGASWIFFHDWYCLNLVLPNIVFLCLVLVLSRIFLLSLLTPCTAAPPDYLYSVPLPCRGIPYYILRYNNFLIVTVPRYSPLHPPI
jgi:hypothetical protein